MALVEVLRNRSEEGSSVVDIIGRTLAESRDTPSVTEDLWFRVSSIGGMCPREEVLCSKNDIVRRNNVDGDVGLNFALGTAIHWMFQNRALGPSGRIIGCWRCTWCGETYGGRDSELLPRPDHCVRCGAIAGEAPRIGGRPHPECLSNAFLYVEEFVGNETYRIGGHPDGYLSDGADTVLLEFKSANDRNFYKYKDTPDFVHVIQSQIYLWLTGLKRARIVYFNKNGSKGTFLREHEIEYDQEAVDRVLAAIKSVRDGVAGGPVPERTICASSSCSRAFMCKARELCFAGDS